MAEHRSSVSALTPESRERVVYEWWFFWSKLAFQTSKVLQVIDTKLVMVIVVRTPAGAIPCFQAPETFMYQSRTGADLTSSFYFFSLCRALIPNHSEHGIE